VSLHDAKRALEWNVITSALTEAGIDKELISIVERARSTDETINSAARVLIGCADAKQAKNYVKFEIVGVPLPFDRAYVELTRPGGQTSHGLRELLRDRLMHVRRTLAAGDLTERMIQDLVAGIDEDLAREAP